VKTVASMDGNREARCTEQLARFFPELQAVELRAMLAPLSASAGRLREAVLIEFAGAGRVIFRSNLPLEFNDRVRLEQTGGQGNAAGTVVALQYHDGQKAVAVQLAEGAGTWVKKL